MYIKRRQRVELPADKTGQFANSLEAAEAELTKFQDAWKERADHGGIDHRYHTTKLLSQTKVNDTIMSGQKIGDLNTYDSYRSGDLGAGVKTQKITHTTDMYAMHDKLHNPGNGQMTPDYLKLWVGAGNPIGKPKAYSRMTKADYITRDLRESLYQPANEYNSNLTLAPGVSQHDATRDLSYEYNTLNTWNMIVDNVAKAKENLANGKETRSKEINIFNRNLSMAAREQNRSTAVARRRRTGTKGHQIDLTGGVAGMGGSGLKVR